MVDSGVINVNKQPGMTSHDVVYKIRRMFGLKTGHTGTLDPLAEGVLPICIGKATKLSQIMTDSDKEYIVEIIFGAETDTQDSTGKITSKKIFAADEQALREAVESFRGGYSQMPPMYSAIKVKGKKLYELARKGIEIERTPRIVNIIDINVIKADLPHRAELLVRCSKGAYMRTLCEDLGRKLDCCAHMGRLIRTEAAGFRIENAFTLEEINEMDDKANAVTLICDIPAVKALNNANSVK
jgi:tRNA pseudouridine55 synthase